MTEATSCTRSIILLLLIWSAVSVTAEDHQTSVQSETQEERQKCRLYLAPSTIPGGGLGIFAGVNFDIGETVMPGDIVVPVDDLSFHVGGSEIDHVDSRVFWLWSDYTWDSNIVGGATFDYEGLAGDGRELENVEFASFGIGAMPNCKFGFVNVHSDPTLADTANEDRNSPSNGAFTPYHERVAKASSWIQAGGEIFENYGHEYFDHRSGLKDVPKAEDYLSAELLVKAMRNLRQKLNRTESETQIPETAVMRDLYDIVVNPAWKSRAIKALPNQPLNESYYTDDKLYEKFLNMILKVPLRQLHLKNTIRSTKWLEKEGICMDGLRSGTSSIPQAGRGAFATRRFRKGDKIAPVPLIHIPQKDILTKYAPIMTEDGQATKERNSSEPIGWQMLLNYAFGHKNSTMLLSPYGHITSLINHAKDANARIVWADKWMRRPEWLELPVDEVTRHRVAGLGFDLVALRDIEKDEEVVIDYGPEWEHAWEKHLASWYAQSKIPTGTSFPYVPAKKLNENVEQVLLDAVENNVDYSRMGHGVTLKCYYYGTALRPQSSNGQIDAMQECRPVKVYNSPETGEQLFVAEIIEWVDTDDHWQHVVHDVLFDASPTIFHFEEDPYTTAHQMPWSFRHEMMIPDDMFPEAWMNLS